MGIFSNRAGAYDTHNDERFETADRIRTEGYEDPRLAEDYRRRMNAPVDEAFARAIAGLQAAYGARGLGGTPMAGGNDAALRAAAARASNSRTANEGARGAKRQRTLDRYRAIAGTWRDANEAAVANATGDAAEMQTMLQALSLMASEMPEDPDEPGEPLGSANAPWYMGGGFGS